MKAKTRQQYIDAWESHINQLIYPFLDAEKPHENFQYSRDQLMAIVREAADNVFAREDSDAA